MRFRGDRGRATWRTAAVGMTLVLAGGCALVPPNSLLDPTKVGRFAVDVHEGGIRRVLTPRDTPPGVAYATDPTPDDLEPIYEEYRFVAGDSFGLTINDFFGQGVPYSATMVVSSLGEIRLPEIGSIRVAGLTEAELEQEVGARVREAGLLPRPIVLAFGQVRRGRIFTILGAVGAPGAYPIPDPDTRLLDAIGMVGDVGAMSRRMYVIRRAVQSAAQVPTEPIPEAPQDRDWIIPPPVEREAPMGGFLTNVGYAQAQPPPNDPEAPPTRDELAELLRPATPPPAASQGAEPEALPPFKPLVFDPQTGRVVEAERPAAPPVPPVAAPEGPAAEQLEEPFDWEDVDEREFAQRVIAIDITELKNGNPRYNIVVRDRDVLNVPQDTGVFYLMGEVNRPGVYALGGRDITIKQALAIAGGFTPLAWPQRCEVIRREPGTDKQLTIAVNLDAIFYGLDDDFYLRDDDIVNVGTHIVAPFLFVIRNSFRFTYGFGFVYDRNFADKDAYGGRLNPEIAEQQRRAQRGLPF